MMSPRPKRQAMVKCPHCGKDNDPARGSTLCWNCRKPLAGAVAPFEFPATGQAVRTVTIDGEPWFVAADVAHILGFREAYDLTRMLDDDEKGPHILRTPGGEQSVTVITEAGLYSAILRSRVPEAKAFKRWVVHEVLPALRRTGTYSVEQAHDIPRSLPEALRAYAAEVEAHEHTQAALAEAAPKADAWDALAEAKGDYSLREAAQILSRDPLISTGQNRLAAYLREIGWVDSTKQPYQREIDNGRLGRRTRDYLDHSSGETKTSTQIRITVKGLKDLRSRMAGQHQLIVIEGGA